MNKIANILPTLFIFITVFIAASLFYACKDDTWDKHYDKDGSIVTENNMWQYIESTPELSEFAGILKAYGYDKILSQSQAYTLFAPTNEALASLDTSQMDVKTELIENHLTRFFIPASGKSVNTIGMLNKKRIELADRGGTFYFGEAPFTVPSKTIIANNGLIHLLSDYQTFFPNIWEYMARRSDLDSIKTYLYSFDELIFDEESSTPGSVVDGQMTYLDSVFIESNSILRMLGHINREDSSYTMIVPNNAAWIEAYDRIKDYYVYYNKKKETADSLQYANARFALVQDLIYNNNTQASAKDSLTSTWGNVFYNPQYLFDGTEQITTSNGDMFITGQLKYKSYESWHVPLVVEAENLLGRQVTLATPYVRSSNSTEFRVSEGRYLHLQPTTSTGNPNVTFEIPNTLSAKYNIYCVFVTGRVSNPSAQGLRPHKVIFNLYYLDNAGKIVNKQFPESEPGTIVTDPYKMDTVLVASGFEFPTANYGEEDATVSLRVASRVLTSETVLYSKELMIDCILLEPVKE